jgi:hypothetical protein
MHRDNKLELAPRHALELRFQLVRVAVARIFAWIRFGRRVKISLHGVQIERPSMNERPMQPNAKEPILTSLNLRTNLHANRLLGREREEKIVLDELQLNTRTQRNIDAMRVLQSSDG